MGRRMSSSKSLGESIHLSIFPENLIVVLENLRSIAENSKFHCTEIAPDDSRAQSFAK